VSRAHRADRNERRADGDPRCRGSGHGDHGPREDHRDADPCRRELRHGRRGRRGREGRRGHPGRRYAADGPGPCRWRSTRTGCCRDAGHAGPDADRAWHPDHRERPHRSGGPKGLHRDRPRGGLPDAPPRGEPRVRVAEPDAGRAWGRRPRDGRHRCGAPRNEVPEPVRAAAEPAGAEPAAAAPARAEFGARPAGPAAREPPASRGEPVRDPVAVPAWGPVPAWGLRSVPRWHRFRPGCRQAWGPPEAAWAFCYRPCRTSPWWDRPKLP
jgi:hypothetical protein